MRPLIFLGDIHGAFSVIEALADKYPGSDIIQVGDFGIGFDSRDMTRIRKCIAILHKNDCRMFACRGNHDNPAFFDLNHPINQISESFQLVPDYTVLNLSGQNILLIGGAISIDRLHRKENVSYWKNELFVLDDIKLKNVIDSYDSIDILVTHTAPSFCDPTGFNYLVYSFAANDSNLLEELITERRKITEAFDAIHSKFKLKMHFYGHFHMNAESYINECMHACLNINSYKILDKFN